MIINFYTRVLFFLIIWILYLSFMNSYAPLGIEWTQWNFQRIYNFSEYLKINGYFSSYGFSVWLAGGGIKGGTVYGATDEFGFEAVENPVSAHDLHATILSLLGFDHESFTYRYSGRDFRLTDVSGEVIKDIIS